MCSEFGFRKCAAVPQGGGQALAKLWEVCLLPLFSPRTCIFTRCSLFPPTAFLVTHGSILYLIPVGLVLSWVRLETRNALCLWEAGRGGLSRASKIFKSHKVEGTRGCVSKLAEGRWAYSDPCSSHTMKAAVRTLLRPGLQRLPPGHNCISMGLRVNTGIYQEGGEAWAKNVGSYRTGFKS